MLAKNRQAYYRIILAFVLCSQSLFVISLQAGQKRAGRDRVVLSQRDARLVERALNYLVRAPRPDVPNESDPSFPIADLGLDDIRRILCTIREQDKKICDKIEDLQEELSIHDMLMEFDHENICSKLETLQENDETICSKIDQLDFDTSAIDGLCSKLEDLDTDLSVHDASICSKIEVVGEALEEHNEIVCSKLEEIGDATFICDTTTIQELIGDPCTTAHEFGSCVDKMCVDESAGSIIRWLKTILWELRGTFPQGTCGSAENEEECTPINSCI